MAGAAPQARARLARARVEKLVTAVARPGTVLAAESVRDELGDGAGFSWSFAGPRHLKGIKGEVKLFRARRGDSIDEDA